MKEDYIIIQKATNYFIIKKIVEVEDIKWIFFFYPKKIKRKRTLDVDEFGNAVFSHLFQTPMSPLDSKEACEKRIKEFKIYPIQYNITA